MLRRSGDPIFWSLMVLTIIDRGVLLGVFAFHYTCTDDVVIWSAALDYGRGFFPEPYFYGQDYGPMLEALVAAPFTRFGIPLNILLPLVTALLAVAPYWSFAFWHRRHQKPVLACLFLAIPLLLPGEYGLLTSLTRGFVTGIGVLAFLPWVMDVRGVLLRSLLSGSVLSVACFVNPNALPFVAAFMVWQLLSAPFTLRGLLCFCLGTVPAVVAQTLAQAYCSAHPERMKNVLFDWRMDLHAEGIAEAFSRLDYHFAWLTPVIWPYGQIIGEALVVLFIVHAWERNWPIAAALLTALVLIVLSFGFAKVHQADHNVFYSYSRMFLALPLLFCWALAALDAQVLRSPVVARCLLAASILTLTLKSALLRDTLQVQLAGINPVVQEVLIEDLRADAAELGSLCEEHQVGLLMLLPERSNIRPQFRAMAHPVLDERIPATYRVGEDNQYWVREAYADSIVRNVLIAGSANGPLRSLTGLNGRVLEFTGRSRDRFALVLDNDLPTDSLFVHLTRRPGRSSRSGS
jgi:hypothetical protein